jgi:hypothetical protein
MRLSTLCASALAVCALGASAVANNNNNEPGSLLVFPLFDNVGAVSIVTVTNTNSDQLNGTIKVEFVYINGASCLEFNKTRTLTANDEFTIPTNLDNPGMEEGFLYVFAKGASGVNNNVPVKFDHLIGTMWIFEGNACAYEYSPVVYNAASRLGEGGPTNTDGDGFRDLNGLEYEKSADELQVPRFFGQVPQAITSELVFVNLTGGKSFDAILDFLIYNDNEEVFSAQHQFRCWDRSYLSEINGAFDNAFLLSTGHALGETSGLLAGGIPVETGWFRMDGNVAFSTQASFPDPAFLALFIERPTIFATAKLPFSTGEQSNGDLLPVSIFGDLSNN